MPLEVLDPGALTTIQDLGRPGFQKYGVSVGGAMDRLALQAANRLVGNDPGAASLEITIGGPRLRARDKCVVAVTGAPFALTVNEKPVRMNTALFLRAGWVLEFGVRERGARAYLAVAGGIDVPLVLNSRSTDVRGGFGGLKGRALQERDIIPTQGTGGQIERAGLSLPVAFENYYDSRESVRVIGGPHDEFFADEAREAFVRIEFSVSELSDRMALRLKADAPLERAGRELLSCGVKPGAVQIPPDGQPIVLMADCQTAGGYPILATVIGADLPRLAQRIAGARVSFREVSVAEALDADEEIRRMLDSIPD